MIGYREIKNTEVTCDKSAEFTDSEVVINPILSTTDNLHYNATVTCPRRDFESSYCTETKQCPYGIYNSTEEQRANQFFSKKDIGALIPDFMDDPDW